MGEVVFRPCLAAFKRRRSTDDIPQSSVLPCGLLGWAFGPRNFMKNHARLREIPDGRGGFSTLSLHLQIHQGIDSANGDLHRLRPRRDTRRDYHVQLI
jgi:hypothetical protein